ncbi:Dienelactone hydrolase family protein [Azotobacter beijerinckii]|uniref:Dienelactone hydrolase family protein n=1 Tax=Azotobacter beijerinckii TaxID=170623 RepID=A0A1H9J9J8_9GAMM|nr:Dienelactone hydrolase family protein [Azotobacter beijerinckii]
MLVAHGEADSFVSDQDIAHFKQEMEQAGASYQFNRYPGAKHGFTNPDADAHAGHGLDIGYQKEADERSWADMQAFLKHVFK